MAEPARRLDDDLNPANRRRHLRAVKEGDTAADFAPQEANESLAPRPNLGLIKGGGETTNDRAKLRAIDDNDLENREDSAEQTPEDKASAKEKGSLGLDGDEDGDDTVGAGFTGGKQSGIRAAIRNRGAKRLGIAGLAGGGIIGFIISLMFVFGPLKLMNIMNMFQKPFLGTVQDAAGQEFDNFMDHYLANYVMPGMTPTGVCSSTKTITKKCVRLPDGKSPVSRWYSAMREARYENKLANGPNALEFKRTPDGNMWVKIGKVADKDGINVTDFAEGKVTALTDSEGFRKIPNTERRAQLKQIVRTATQDEVAFKRSITRFKIGRLLEEKYGIRRCIFACKTRDKIDDTKVKVKNAFLSVMAERLIEPHFEMYGVVLQCMLDEDCHPDNIDKDPATIEAGVKDCTPGVDCGLNGEVLNEGRKTAQQKLNELAAKYGVRDIAKLSELYKGIEEKGIGATLTKEIVGKLFGEVAGKAAGKAVPIIGWVKLASDIVVAADGVGPKIKALHYGIVWAPAVVQAYSSLAAANAEMVAGYNYGSGSPTSIGNPASMFATAQLPSLLNFGVTNFEAIGDANRAFDNAEGTPLYQALANGKLVQSDSKICNDDKAVPDGEIVCPEELPKYDITALNYINDYFESPPGKPLYAVASAVHSVLGIFEGIFGGIISKAIEINCALLPGKIDVNNDDLTSLSTMIKTEIPGLGPSYQICMMQDLIPKIAPEIIKAVAKYIIPSPVHDNMDNLFTLAAGGADVAGRESAENNLGGGPLTAAQSNEIQSALTEQETIAFQSQSFMGRMFNTEYNQSFVNQAAIALPSYTSLGSFGDWFIGAVGNPLGHLSSMLQGSIFSKKVSADTDFNPFHTTRIGYPHNDPIFKEDPEKTWADNNCDDPQTLIKWRQGSANNVDDATAEAVPTNTNPCLLLGSVASMSSALYTSSLMSDDDKANLGAPTAAASTTTGATKLSGISTGDSTGPCPANTKDLGIVRTRYNGNPSIRLCQLSSIGGYGNNPSGTQLSGGAVLSSQVATQFQAMGEKAKADGVSLSANSSFRLADSCGGGGDGSSCARPGSSPHQLGVAIDFNGIPGKGTSTTSCSGRARARGNTYWEWLNNNAAQWGIKQYTFEAWHWDPTGGPTRCGGDGT